MATLVLNNDALSAELESDHILIKRHGVERDSETGGVYLGASARRKVLVACESALSRPLKPIGKAERTTMRLAIDEQVLEFVRYLEKGQVPEFFRLA